MSTKYNTQSFRQLIKEVIFPKDELGRRRSFVLGSDDSIRRIVVEFSSPNIAKPFHYGHLKSTIFGNYLANLHGQLGIQVTRLNYLGDWGTQFGLLGLHLKQTNCDLNQVSNEMVSPMNFLVKNYVEANKKAKEDELFFQQAKEHFKSIEENPNIENPSYVQWNTVKSLSMDELVSSYAELGISFDVYDFESNYSQASKQIVDQLLARGIAFRLEDGAVICNVIKNDRVWDVPVLKSDGSSLYLSRDLAALVDRKKRFDFDRILYVAGADQARHFHSLSEIGKRLLKPFGHQEDAGSQSESISILKGWQDSQEKEARRDQGELKQDLVHVKTGKVIGMSTRGGNFLLLSDLINEAKERYILKTQNTPTSKVTSDDSSESEQVGKDLALSALFFYDLRFKRMRNYQFNWDAALSDGSESGLNLQATHARLCSLIRRATSELKLEPLKEFDETPNLNPINGDAYDAIDCLEAIQLLETMQSFDAVLKECYESLESAPLIGHSTNLCRAINRARQLKELRVLGETNDLKARARLTLFVRARDQLASIIRLVGLKALDKV